MSGALELMGLEDFAPEVAGTWKRFEWFTWDRLREIPDPDSWGIVYTHNRDSGLLGQSNASAIAKALESLTEGGDPDVVFENHSHWLVAHVDGFSIRVYRDGQITEAFETYRELVERLSRYAVLDEPDYSRQEYEATLANIAEAAALMRHAYKLPEGWEGEVYRWLSDHRERSVENRDDRGGYPSQDDLLDAFQALGYKHEDTKLRRD